MLLPITVLQLNSPLSKQLFNCYFLTMEIDEQCYPILPGLEDGLPDGMMEMFDMEFDFPPRTHCLSRW